MNEYRVLFQEMVSTPGTELDRDIVEDDGDSESDCIIDMGALRFKISKRGLVVEGGVLADIVIVVDIAGSLV
jgi:hypothetical protein